MTNLQCLQCGASLQVGHNFCEECGTPLAVFSSSVNMDRCEKCGVAGTKVDGEGFCLNCGFRREKPNNDRFEVVTSPHLACVSDRGLRHHRNEDFVACAEVDARKGYVMVVCDGVSSSESPELASKAAASEACRVLEELSIKDTQTTNEELMKKGVAAAMTAVCAIYNNSQKTREAPSTTIVAAIVMDGVATIGWLGDSRAYWVSPSGSRLLTKDDSWFNEVVSSGEMTEAQAQQSCNAHAITRWLGADAVDFEPSIVEFTIPGSGYLLLCSDGLWNYADEVPYMEAVVNHNSHPEAAIMARGLVDFAKQSGGHDNITVGILSI